MTVKVVCVSRTAQWTVFSTVPFADKVAAGDLTPIPVPPSVLVVPSTSGAWKVGMTYQASISDQ